MNKYRREKVGFVWQQSARNLVPYLNAIDNVMLPMTLAGITGKGKRKRAEELLDLVGLRERMKHYLPELSGGEQQRVAIAVGLANNPTLLLADEPTGEVDSATAKTIYDTFRTLTGEMGITTLIVSHDPGIARQVERVVGIRDGMLASETLRQTRTSQVESEDSNGKVTTESHEEHHYEELVVVDRAGRLHIPKEYLEQFSIRGRAQLEVTEHGILIRSTEQDRIEVEVTKQHHTQGQGSSTGGLLGRLGLGRSKAPEKIIEQKKVE
jgi:ABC-type lipoprotein export system ATPase subunit/bifunctional DNA-binding transcriptional regulator/antitoxin component of YhaV-PrlF toxin-antitoxin module